MFTPIIAGLIAALVVYFLSTFVNDRPAQRGNRRYVVYGLGFKLLAAAFFPVSAFVTYAALQASPDQKVIAGIIAILFWLGTFYLAYDFFFVSLGYDDRFIYHWSPIKRSRKIPWAAVKDIQYSGLTQTFSLKTDGYGSITVSPYANGCRTLVEYAANLLEVAVPFSYQEGDHDSDADPDA